MVNYWLPGALRVDLTAHHGNGPFIKPVLGVIAHCNQSIGNLANYFRESTNVCPNFQVYRDGTIEQYLPLDWQPWCQSAGNDQYGAIETEGYGTAISGHPATGWTAAQLASIATIVNAYNDLLGVPLILAERPGDYGFGWHGMGGTAWGGHPDCPGDIRRAQRATVLDIITHPTPTPPPPPPEDNTMARPIVSPYENSEWLVAGDFSSRTWITDNVQAFVDDTANYVIRNLTPAQMATIPVVGAAPPTTT